MDDERARHIAEGLPLVRAVAKRVAGALPPHASLEDLVAAGHAGLVEAADRYDPARGARFTTFAYYRVRGAIFDHVRATCRDDVALRARAHAEAAVDALVTERLGDAPAPESPAAAAAALGDLLGEITAAFSLAEIVAATAPAAPPDPEELTLRAEQGAHLEAALGRLPDLERSLLQRVYVEGLSVAEAGEALGISRSWSGRLHARALAVLRDALARVADGL